VFSLRLTLPLLILTLLILPSNAANRVKTVVTGEVILASDWNAEFDNIYSDVTHTISGTWTFDKAGTPITITPASAPAADTVLFDINTTGGLNNLFSVDYEGDILATGGAVFNDGSLDSDFRVESNANINMFLIDSNEDQISIGAAAGTGSGTDLFVHPAARSADANEDFHVVRFGSSGALTIPAGTAALVTELYVQEPNITATGTVTNAATLYVLNAPTEGGSNYALWVDAGMVRIDDGITYPTEVTTTTDTLTVDQCGDTIFLSSATEFVTTLPVATTSGCYFKFVVQAAPSGASYTIVTNSSDNILIGGVDENEVDTGQDGPYSAVGDIITFVDGVAVVGDWVEMISNGTSWYLTGMTNADGGVTIGST